MQRISTGLFAAAIALGAATVLGSAPVQARPAIVERLAEINTRGTGTDHGGLAYNERFAAENESARPGGVWVASGDGFGSTDDASVGRPTIVRRLAEINVAGTDKDHGGLSFSSRTLR
ncbi:MAG: hypothetical protein AAFY15_01770 [Cyanobacteria bacterium J06648_11]